MKVYEKPVVSVHAGMTEGVYAASGAGGIKTGNKTIAADWGGSGQAKFDLDLSNVNLSQLTVVLTFNMDISSCWGSGAGVICSGKTATLTWHSAPTSAEITVQANGDIKNLQITGSSYSNNFQ